MSTVMKRKDLRPGQQYVIFNRSHCALPGGFRPITYRRVHLVELQPNNRALVTWDEVTHDLPIGYKNRRVITLRRSLRVSCSQFLALAEDWDQQGHVYDIRAKHCVLKPFGSQEMIS